MRKDMKRPESIELPPEHTYKMTLKHIFNQITIQILLRIPAESESAGALLQVLTNPLLYSYWSDSWPAKRSVAGFAGKVSVCRGDSDPQNIGYGWLWNVMEGCPNVPHIFLADFQVSGQPPHRQFRKGCAKCFSPRLLENLMKSCQVILRAKSGKEFI